MKCDIIIDITFPINKPENLLIQTNGKNREVIGDLLCTYIQDCCIGQGADIFLCRHCAESHHENWDEQWADYHGGLL